MFTLHDDLARDCVEIGCLTLCRVLLRTDANYPWLILVPARADIREIHELDASDRAVLIEEIATVSAAMNTEFKADKMNIGALGNATPQLHIHVVARYRNDTAGLGPIWGAAPEKSYTPDALADMETRCQRMLGFD